MLREEVSFHLFININICRIDGQSIFVWLQLKLHLNILAHRFAIFLCSWDVDDSLVGQLTTCLAVCLYKYLLTLCNKSVYCGSPNQQNFLKSYQRHTVSVPRARMPYVLPARYFLKWTLKTSFSANLADSLFVNMWDTLM